MINQATIVGRVGSKKTHTFSNGSEVTNLTIATSHKYMKDGERKEKTTWHNVSLFSKLSDIAKQYVNQGDLVFVQGEMDTQKFQGKDGEECTKFIIIGHKVQIISSPKTQNKSTKSEPDPAFVDDDLPF
jgi:single-strand DNA-binding protein